LTFEEQLYDKIRRFRFDVWGTTIWQSKMFLFWRLRNNYMTK